jgi:hypothetical protein
MANITKIDLSRQSKLNKYTQADVNLLIKDNETLLYISKESGHEGELWIAKKNENEPPEHINPGRNYIKNLVIPDLPPDPNALNPFEGYALCVVRNGFNFDLVWALVETKENYNTPL